MNWRAAILLALTSGCWGSKAYIIEGEVIEVRSATKLVIKHEEVPGLMPAMTMPFTVRDPSLMDGIEPGDQVYARLIAEEDNWWLADLREHNKPGASTAPKSPEPKDVVAGPAPLRPGAQLPAISLEGTDGSTVTIGAGQGHPTVVTFLFTTCPRPDFCPAIRTRLQALQSALKDTDARLVAITIDPERDTLDVLRAYATDAGAVAPTWRFARPTPAQLKDITTRAALALDTSTGTDLLHALRTWVLDADGRLIERYDDARFPHDRVVQQLTTGGPPAPEGADGTATPKDD
ncbi:MAG: SCO family protein [Myxococcota bacterium]